MYQFVEYQVAVALVRGHAARNELLPSIVEMLRQFFDDGRFA